jgi:hypothetical protein
MLLGLMRLGCCCFELRRSGTNAKAGEYAINELMLIGNRFASARTECCVGAEGLFFRLPEHDAIMAELGPGCKEVIWAVGVGALLQARTAVGGPPKTPVSMAGFLMNGLIQFDSL